jgi:methionyl-tRNA formyltransferase
MKIQILISKNSWANQYVNLIRKKLKTKNDSVFIYDNHKKLKSGYDINVIFSYFKIISKKYLLKSKHNIIPHESNLPFGRGMSPLTWQILNSKNTIVFSLFEADQKVDAGKVYYKKKVKIAKNLLFNEIKKKQLNINLNLIYKFISFYKKNGIAPKSLKQNGKPSYFKTRKPLHSKMSLSKSIRSQFNLLRVCDEKNYPAYFKIFGKKYIIKLKKI